MNATRQRSGEHTYHAPSGLHSARGSFHPEVTFLDYGCGRGDDIRTLADLGYDCVGWDPAYRPDGELRTSEVVNLGYVVNVIEDPRERVETLRAAWDLASRVLIVAARVDVQTKPEDTEKLADGFLTVRGTFQKFYKQSELRDWIDHTLGVVSVAAGPGIFLIFRSEEDRQRFSSTPLSPTNIRTNRKGKDQRRCLRCTQRPSRSAYRFLRGPRPRPEA